MHFVDVRGCGLEVQDLVPLLDVLRTNSTLKSICGREGAEELLASEESRGLVFCCKSTADSKLSKGDLELVKAERAVLIDIGVNALAGGNFEPRPVKSWRQKLQLCWGVTAGYFDLYSDILGTCLLLSHKLQSLTIAFLQHSDLWLVQ